MALAWLLLAFGSAALGQEHQFGLRVGNTVFEGPRNGPDVPSVQELRLSYRLPGCIGGSPSPCSFFAPTGEPLSLTGSFLNDAIHLNRGIDGTRTLLNFRRSFDPEEFEGNFIAVTYEWRRHGDSHFSLAVDAGVFSADATHVFAGNARRDDPNEDAEDPFDFDNDGNFGIEDIPMLVTDTLEFNQYFLNFEPRYNFMVGKWRFFVGGGLGVWANLWREIVSVEYLDISCSPSLDPTCSTVTFRESDGDQRTIIPFLASVGVHYRFLPHWSVELEDRFVFNAEGDATLHGTTAEYGVGGNQVMLGFAYKQ